MSDDWKYDIEDLEDADDTDDTAADSATGRVTDVFGERSSGDIEPGSPTLENTLFVLVGVALTLLFILV